MKNEKMRQLPRSFQATRRVPNQILSRSQVVWPAPNIQSTVLGPVHSPPNLRPPPQKGRASPQESSASWPIRPSARSSGFLHPQPALSSSDAKGPPATAGGYMGGYIESVAPPLPPPPAIHSSLDVLLLPGAKRPNSTNNLFHSLFFNPLQHDQVYLGHAEPHIESQISPCFTTLLLRTTRYLVVSSPGSLSFFPSYLLSLSSSRHGCQPYARSSTLVFPVPLHTGPFLNPMSPDCFEFHPSASAP